MPGGLYAREDGGALRFVTPACASRHFCAPLRHSCVRISSLLRVDLLLTARGTAYLPPEGRHVYRPWDGKFTARGAVSDEP